MTNTPNPGTEMDKAKGALVVYLVQAGLSFPDAEKLIENHASQARQQAKQEFAEQVKAMPVLSQRMIKKVWTSTWTASPLKRTINPFRRWWQFWKPKYIWVPHYTPESPQTENEK